MLRIQQPQVSPGRSSSTENNLWPIVGLGIGAAAIGGLAYFLLSDEKEKPQQNRTALPPSNQSKFFPNVCEITSPSGDTSSAIPLNDREFLVSSHSVGDTRLPHTITCGDQPSKEAIVVCNNPTNNTQFTQCRAFSKFSMNVSPTRRYLPWNYLRVGATVRITASFSGKLEECYGTIDNLDQLKRIYIKPDRFGIVRAGYSNGKVEVIHNDQANYIGYIESCYSFDEQTCSSLILVIHPESLIDYDRNHNLLLRKLGPRITQLSAIPNIFSRNLSKEMINDLWIIAHQLKPRQLFVDERSSPHTLVKGKYVRIDFQEINADKSRNFQAQVNIRGSGTTIATVFIPEKYQDAKLLKPGSTFDIFLLSLFKYALDISLNSENIIALT